MLKAQELYQQAKQEQIRQNQTIDSLGEQIQEKKTELTTAMEVIIKCIKSR